MKEMEVDYTLMSDPSEVLDTPADGTFRMYAGGTTQGVMDPRYQNLGDQFLAATPVNRKPCVFTRFSSIAQGLMPSGSEQCEFGSVWMVLKGVALDLGQTLPVTKLPLGAAAFEQVFVVGKG